MTSIASRRRLVHERLSLGASRKVQRAGTKEAIACVREAYNLACQPPKLEPWAALAAYRLAHLLLRGAPDREQLEAADALFAEAAREPALGPYPRIYRLAVLGRLDVPHVRLEHRFKDCVRAYDDWVRAQAPPDHDPSEHAVSAPIQTDLFGLIELAGYALGLDRAPLDGRGARLDEPHLRGEHWRLVGPDPALASVLLSEAMARAELDALRDELRATVSFVLPPARDGAVVRVGDGPWSDLPHKAARLLASLLRGDAPDDRSLVLRVTGGDGDTSRAGFRQVKRRLREQLRDLGAAAPVELVVQAPGERPRLAPELVVLGAVSEAGYADTE